MPTSRYILFSFCLLLVLFFIGQFVDLDLFPDVSENRVHAKKPVIAWSFASMTDFPKKYEEYFNDSFGFRNALLWGNFSVRYGLLGVSPASDSVKGRDGWLFYSGGRAIDDVRGISKFDENNLRRWARDLQMRKDYLAQFGIRYLFIIAPNKSTIYPELLPPGYKKVRERTLYDDLISYVRQNTNVEIIDLRQVLFNHKHERDLYYKTDEHWNRYGSFLAYREIMRPVSRWFPIITPYELDDFTISTTRIFGDAGEVMGWRTLLSEGDLEYVFTPKKPFEAVLGTKAENHKAPFFYTNSNGYLPRAIVFHDSFFNQDNIAHFFSQHFSMSLYISGRWYSLDQIDNLINNYRPHIVVEEMIERLIKDQ